jgi:hypothetical protein
MKDKLLKWKKTFPYEAAKAAGIEPNSSMLAVKKASLQVLGPNLKPELREALEELRLIKRRLFIDFFLYQIDGEIVSPDLLDKEIAVSIEEISAPADLASFLTPDTTELQTMEQDFQEIMLPEIDLEYLVWPEAEVPTWRDLIEFDS